MMNNEEYIDCIYNWWSGFRGKETCEAGYLVCKEKNCENYCPIRDDND